MSSKDDTHALLSKNFYLFAVAAFKSLYKENFEVMDFHKDIFIALQKVYNGEIQRLIINMPPQHGKSEILALFQAYVLFNNPKARNILICSTSSLHRSKNVIVKNYIRSELFEKYTDIQIDKKEDSKAEWATVQGGKQFSTTVKGQAIGFSVGRRGFSGGTGGVMVLDDPNKPSDILFELQRNAVIQNWKNTFSTRSANLGTPVVVIQQRLHEEDFSGYCLSGKEGNRWSLLKIPVYAKDGSENTIYPRIIDYRTARVTEMRDPFEFAGLYLQEPSNPKGNIIKKEDFEYGRMEDIKGLDKYMFIDGAYTENITNDPTGIIVVAFDPKKRRLYIIDAKKKYFEFPRLLAYTKKLSAYYNCQLVLAEPKAVGKSLVQMLRDSGTSAVEIKSRWAEKDKLVKAKESRVKIEGGHVYLIEGNGYWHPEFLHEVTSFPTAKHDDFVDCLCYAIEYFLLTNAWFVF